MTTLFDQMREHVELAKAEGHEVKRWTIRTDHYLEIEKAARADGLFVEDFKTILGVPFDVADRVASDDGILAIETGPIK